MPTKNYPEKDKTDSVFGNLSKPQKIAVIVLAVVAVLVVVFWIMQFKSQLTSPFSVDSGNNEEDLVKYLDPQQRDTDGDGLSDYDESTLLGTSVYLEDTDSDGLSDKEELDAGTDPLCPTGENCNNLQETLNPDNTLENQIQSNLIPPTDIDASNVDQEFLQKAINGQSDVETLRLILIQSGANEEMINSISDEDLMKIYQESLNSQNQ